ncbi:UbiA family prenyltransferase [Conexivisphaera calida]|uniref:(S)-2,3-di-O-geranylgeranylglyceryl phosphate synthase n=1 Tax=Conexivisphaera calida TaxID=1874277 RepID=A0A4P2VAW4_9ARCH|nr:UbiA family prenyltransferase [Conexivisphaera calida]BBE41629.1 (S)-2,3-di-O-geranylgeranylglyceryl phosphate synthase [Conexivisphaera calida]
MRSRALIEILRPVNDVMIGIAVIAGYLVGGGRAPLPALEGFLTGFLISGYSMVINDIFDVRVDILNRRMRPLVRGDLSIGGAWALALSTLALGMVTSALTGMATLVIAAIFAALAFLYSAKLKMMGLAGNIVVALSMAIPFLYGGVMGGINYLLVFVMFSTSFLTGLSREVLKAIADVKGDAASGIRSLPATAGVEVSAVLSAALIALAVPIAYIPVIAGLRSPWYVSGVSIASLIFILMAIDISKLRDPQRAYVMKKRMLIPMAIGLITYVVQGLLLA